MPLCSADACTPPRPWRTPLGWRCSARVPWCLAHLVATRRIDGTALEPVLVGVPVLGLALAIIRALALAHPSSHRRGAHSGSRSSPVGAARAQLGTGFGPQLSLDRRHTHFPVCNFPLVLSCAWCRCAHRQPAFTVVPIRRRSRSRLRHSGVTRASCACTALAPEPGRSKNTAGIREPRLRGCDCPSRTVMSLGTRDALSCDPHREK